MGKYTDENIRIFMDESLEHLSDIENELLAIEQGGADIDENLVNKVYRAAHSMKGGAGFMDLPILKISPMKWKMSWEKYAPVKFYLTLLSSMFRCWFQTP